MSNYLSGRNTPGIRVLGSSIRHLFEWDVRPNKEIQKIEDLNTVSIEAGIYVIYDSGGQVLYLGKATNLRNELKQTLNRKIPSGLRLGPKLNKQRPKLKELAAYYSIFEVPSPRARHNMEAFLLRVFINQTHNTNIGSFR
jgi:excinuclease UvrABC nuclease subunit